MADSSLGENLRAARHKKQLSQERLARQTDCSTGTIVRTERGATIPRADVLARIARELETTVEALLAPTSEVAAS